MANSQSTAKALSILAVLAITAIVVFAFLSMPDRRTAGEKIGDAVDALPGGVDKAARELQDRSPGEKLGDALKDTGDEIKQNTDR